MIKPEDIANVRGMSMKDGKVNMELEVARELMLAMAASAIAMLEDAHAPNFIEMELACANHDIPHTILSIGYANRPTPLDIIAKLRGKLIELYNMDEMEIMESGVGIGKLLTELGYGDMLDGD